MWRDYYSMEYSISNGALFIRLQDIDGEIYYYIPMGIDIFSGLNILKKELNVSNIKFSTVSENLVEALKQTTLNFSIVEETDFEDYVYNSCDLCLLQGKKFAGQRNMIHQFIRENPNWSYEEITLNNIEEIKQFLANNYSISANASDFELEEESKVKEVLGNLNAYNFIGSCLKVAGKVVGFSLGEIVQDMAYIHIEKADRNVKGAYQMLVNQFALRYTNSDIKYINREEDVGDLGLRNSKLSYHPIDLLKKYIIEVTL